MPRACIALGSNLGDRRANLQAAIDSLASSTEIRLLAASRFIETAPVDCPAGAPGFLNAAAVVETGLTPQALLGRLLEIEESLGRRRTSETRNAPRTIDLDLLLYGELVIDEPELVIPHPRMHERRFVLEPLAQISPSARHPVLKRTIAELLAALAPSDTQASADLRGSGQRR